MIRWLAVGVFLLLLVGLGAWAQPPATPAPSPSPPSARSPLQPPTTRVRDCTTSGCHSAQLDHKVLHGPTAVLACDACHEYKDETRHSFQMKRTGRDLCAFCHIDKTGMEGIVVHDPVAKGDCLACHDPHGATDHHMLRRPTMAQTCAACHKDAADGSANVHRPVAAGDCTVCHEPHTSSHPSLLVAEKRPLCLSCHAEVQLRMDKDAHVHDPAQGECLQCHDPHASPQGGGPALLKAAPRQLCASCHRDVEMLALSAPHQHPAVLEGQACLNCHAPHSSSRASLMKADPVTACLECHKNPIEKKGQGIIGGLSELAPPHPLPFLHGPIRDGKAVVGAGGGSVVGGGGGGGGCTGCHSLHGSEEPHLLTLPYTDAFYQPFRVESYALCLSCHDKSLVLDKETGAISGEGGGAAAGRGPGAARATLFRDGTRNLHYVHVNRDIQGRSCRACHATHAADNAALIRATVPYGAWQLPINFRQTETGGSCSPGCHKAAAYDRVKPKGEPAPPPPTPGPTPPPAGPSVGR